MKGCVLVVDDDLNLRKTLAEILRGHGFDVLEAGSGGEALRLMHGRAPDLVFCDWKMTDGGGEQVLRALQERSTTKSPPPVVVMTAYGTSDVTIRAMQLGAYDFVTKPLDLDEICATADRAFGHVQLQREVEELRRRVPAISNASANGLIGTSRPMMDVFKAIARVAPTESSVLIQGESGTQKHLVAQAIHDNSPRHDRPFVTINCAAAVPAELLEAELFGYEKGAFTGAAQRRAGGFEAAEGGTVFLDEIGELPLALQPKLLRVLQDHCVERLGSNERVQADFRVVAATNRDLSDAVEEGAFRQDLYFRLNAFTIVLPPLRARRSDIVPLADRFASLTAERSRLPLPAFSEPALVALQQYGYPGNVRELEHIVERAVVLSQGRVILPEHLSFDARLTYSAGLESLLALPFHESVEAWEKLRVQRALEESGGSKTEAARRLGIRRRLLYEKLQHWKME